MKTALLVICAGFVVAGCTERPAAEDARGLADAARGSVSQCDDEHATWTDPSGDIHNCRDQAVSQTQKRANTTDLAGTTWRLVQFQSPDDNVGTVVPPNVERYRLTFSAGGALALQLDCNRGTGRWEATPSSSVGGMLTITGGAMTRVMCVSGALDAQIARDLSQVHSYTIAGDRLYLALESDAGVYVWQLVPGG